MLLDAIDALLFDRSITDNTKITAILQIVETSLTLLGPLMKGNISKESKETRKRFLKLVIFHDYHELMINNI